MKSTLKVSRSEVLTEIQSLPGQLRKTARALYGRTSKNNRTPASITPDEKKKIMALYKAGLAYRTVEAVAHMTPRNGMSAYSLLNKASKAPKAKKAKTPKAKKVAQTGTVTPDTATKHVPEVAPVAPAAPAPVAVAPVVETPTVATPAPAPVAQTEAAPVAAQ